MSADDPMCWASYRCNGCYHGPLLCGTPNLTPTPRQPKPEPN